MNKTNNDYRQFLMKNTNTIMKENYKALNPVIIQSIKRTTYPYLFNGINDHSQPYGYESSYPKQIYLNKEEYESNRRNPLQNEI